MDYALINNVLLGPGCFFCKACQIPGLRGLRYCNHKRQLDSRKRDGLQELDTILERRNHLIIYWGLDH